MDYNTIRQWWNKAVDEYGDVLSPGAVVAEEVRKATEAGKAHRNRFESAQAKEAGFDECRPRVNDLFFRKSCDTFSATLGGVLVRLNAHLLGWRNLCEHGTLNPRYAILESGPSILTLWIEDGADYRSNNVLVSQIINFQKMGRKVDRIHTTSVTDWSRTATAGALHTMVEIQLELHRGDRCPICGGFGEGIRTFNKPVLNWENVRQCHNSHTIPYKGVVQWKAK